MKPCAGLSVNFRDRNMPQGGRTEPIESPMPQRRN